MMASRCLKVLVGLGTAALLLGCASHLSTPEPQRPASHAPLPSAKSPPASSTAPQVAEQATAPAASDPGDLQPDQTPVPAVVVAEAPWKQRGLASWYGKKFHGRRTASGERFNAAGLTAAHRTLPISSYVRVRRVSTGEEVVVRINDRGPFHPGRVLDLSYAAAHKLGIVALGSAEVEMELVAEGD